ncbi:hypothetical protein AB0G15_04405 [Streptosporangium sp. NPDC023825]|uniref:hypothetical protein n=1 Tax=Streptosporangium sp. NPDC023825 TaxID=3154909 RepID=UPI0034212828
MAGPYRGLSSTPGVRGFVAAGLFGRIPMSMPGIGVILLIKALTGSYATAGAVAAVAGVSLAVAAPRPAPLPGPVAAPPPGRLVDRSGQARVAIPPTLTHGATLTGMMLRAHHGAPAGRSSPPASRPARPRPARSCAPAGRT